jgi:hypothetical protein
MKAGIEAMRRMADECERRAKLTQDKNVRSELIDLAAQCHSLARRTAALLDQETQIDFA